MTAGLTSTGFQAETLQDVLTDIQDDQHANVSAELDTTPSSPDGQRNAVTARQAALLWELVAAVTEVLDPEKAEDDQLVSLCKLTGTVPQGASFGSVTASCTLTSGTVLLAGTHYAQVQGRSELWTPQANFTAPSSGAFSVTFVCTTAGPAPAFAGTLTVINAGPAGWTAATNPLDAKQGSPADTNESLRARREAELAQAGSTTALAVRADLLELADANGTLLLQDVTVLENDSDATDARGVPQHSMECVVSDNPPVADTTIAAAVLAAVGGGIRKYGQVSSTATDELGNVYPIGFSRPQDLPIYVSYWIRATADFDAQIFKEAVVEALSGSHGIGSTVRLWDCETAARQPTVIDLVPPGTGQPPVTLGLSVSPTAAVNIVPSSRQRPVFDTAHVTVTVLS